MNLTPEEQTGAILVVVGIIIIEGIWLAWLTYSMWKRHQEEKASRLKKKVKAKSGMRPSAAVPGKARSTAGEGEVKKKEEEDLEEEVNEEEKEEENEEEQEGEA